MEKLSRHEICENRKKKKYETWSDGGKISLILQNCYFLSQSWSFYFVVIKKFNYIFVIRSNFNNQKYTICNVNNFLIFPFYFILFLG